MRKWWWEADERPEPRSLGLLPSGPDPVGEWLVHRQPPGPISAERNENASRRRARSTVASTRSDHARALEKFRNGGEGFVPLLEHLVFYYLTPLVVVLDDFKL